MENPGPAGAPDGGGASGEETSTLGITRAGADLWEVIDKTIFLRNAGEFRIDSGAATR